MFNILNGLKENAKPSIKVINEGLHTLTGAIHYKAHSLITRDDQQKLFLAAQDGIDDEIIRLLELDQNTKEDYEAEDDCVIIDQDDNKPLPKYDINLLDTNTMSLLAYAAKYGRTSTVTLLLNNGADIMQKCLDNWDMVMIASRLDEPEVLNILLEHAKNIKKQDGVKVHLDRAHNSALMIASRSGKAENVKLLLDFGFDIQAQDKVERNALDLAIINNHTDLVPILLEAANNIGKKAELINKVRTYGYSPLLDAASNTNYKILYLLFENGADIRVIEKLGRDTKDKLDEFPIKPEIQNILLGKLLANYQTQCKSQTSSSENQSKPINIKSTDNSKKLKGLTNLIPEFTPGFVEELSDDDPMKANGQLTDFDNLDNF